MKKFFKFAWNDRRDEMFLLLITLLTMGFAGYTDRTAIWLCGIMIQYEFSRMILRERRVVEKKLDAYEDFFERWKD